MPAQQPTLDGTLPEPALNYASWVDQVRAAFVAAARSGQRFTTYDVAREHHLPEPPNPRADWGNLTQLLVRERLIERLSYEQSSRPTGERSAVAVWRGTRAAQTGRAA